MLSSQRSNSSIPEEFAQSPGYLFTQATKQLRKSIEETLKPLSLTPHEYGLLRVVSVKGPCAQNVFGNHFAIDKTSVTNIVDNLEKRDLIYKGRDKSDKRINLLYLTPKGVSTLSNATRKVNKVYKQFLEPLDDKEWEQCKNSILKLLVHHRF